MASTDPEKLSDTDAMNVFLELFTFSIPISQLEKLCSWNNLEFIKGSYHVSGRTFCFIIMWEGKLYQIKDDSQLVDIINHTRTDASQHIQQFDFEGWDATYNVFRSTITLTLDGHTYELPVAVYTTELFTKYLAYQINEPEDAEHDKLQIHDDQLKILRTITEEKLEGPCYYTKFNRTFITHFLSRIFEEEIPKEFTFKYSGLNKEDIHVSFDGRISNFIRIYVYKKHNTDAEYEDPTIEFNLETFEQLTTTNINVVSMCVWLYQCEGNEYQMFNSEVAEILEKYYLLGVPKKKLTIDGIEYLFVLFDDSEFRFARTDERIFNWKRIIRLGSLISQNEIDALSIARKSMYWYLTLNQIDLIDSSIPFKQLCGFSDDLFKPAIDNVSELLYVKRILQNTITYNDSDECAIVKLTGLNLIQSIRQMEMYLSSVNEVLYLKGSGLMINPYYNMLKYLFGHFNLGLNGRVGEIFGFTEKLNLTTELGKTDVQPNKTQQLIPVFDSKEGEMTISLLNPGLPLIVSNQNALSLHKQGNSDYCLHVCDTNVIVFYNGDENVLKGMKKYLSDTYHFDDFVFKKITFITIDKTIIPDKNKLYLFYMDEHNVNDDAYKEFLKTNEKTLKEIKYAVLVNNEEGNEDLKSFAIRFNQYNQYCCYVKKAVDLKNMFTDDPNEGKLLIIYHNGKYSLRQADSIVKIGNKYFTDQMARSTDGSYDDQHPVIELLSRNHILPKYTFTYTVEERYTYSQLIETGLIDRLPNDQLIIPVRFFKGMK